MNDGGHLDFIFGDIAQSDCEAIVNPCNRGFLLSHGGVNGAIAAAAGPACATEWAQLPNRSWGADVLVTGAGTLQARYVIHAVSPIWNGSVRDKEGLHRLHVRVLRVASSRGCRTVALPAIGTGAHRFPPEVAASIAVPTVEAFLGDDSTLERVSFYFQTRATLHDYLVRSGSHDQRVLQIAGLRDEITDHLRHAKRTELAEAIEKTTDEATLRAIISEAHSLVTTAHADARDNSASVGASMVYVRAAEHVLKLDPG